MEKIITSFARHSKRLAKSLRNAPLFALCAIVSISVEVFAWGGIIRENQATVDIFGLTVRLAYAEVAMSTAFSLAALVLAAAAAAHKADPRPAQRRRAAGAQWLAVIVLIAPIYYAGNCLALQATERDRAAYVGSDQHRADLRQSEDASLDSIAQRAASNRLGQANQVAAAKIEHLVSSILWIALILGCNMAAIRVGWRPRPETPAEAKARIATLRALKAKATRERNKKERADASNVTQFRRA